MAQVKYIEFTYSGSGELLSQIKDYDVKSAVIFNSNKSLVFFTSKVVLAKFDAITFELYQYRKESLLFGGDISAPDATVYIPTDPPYIYAPQPGFFKSFDLSLNNVPKFDLASYYNGQYNAAYQGLENSHVLYSCEGVISGTLGNYTITKSYIDPTNGKRHNSTVVQSHITGGESVAKPCKRITFDPVTNILYLLPDSQSMEITTPVPIYTISAKLLIEKTHISDIISDFVVYDGKMYTVSWNADQFSKVAYYANNQLLIAKDIIPSNEKKSTLAFEATKMKLFVAFPNLIRVYSSTLVFEREFTLVPGETFFHESLILNPETGLGYVSASTRSPEWFPATNDIIKSGAIRFPLGSCQNYTSCSSCVEADYCGWCFIDNKCSPKGFCSEVTTFISNSSSCLPKPATVSPTSFYLDVGVNLTITAVGGFFDPGKFAVPHAYTCHFGNNLTTSATYLNSDSVKCNLDGLTGVSLTETVSVQVNLNGIHFVGPVNIDAINCEYSKSCVSCNSLSQDCSWCASSGTCVSDTFSCSSFLSACPDPAITSISKTISPIAGGTQLVIIGANFYQDLLDVQIAGESCNSTVNFNFAESTITCTVPQTDAPKSGPVSLYFKSKGWTNSTNTFEYVNNPQIDNFTPIWSFNFGNANISISGDYFDSLPFTLRLGNATNFCDVIYSNKTYILCETVATTSQTGKMRITMASAVTESSSSFEIKDPPQVSSLNPKLSPSSGGVTLMISGTGFLAGSSVKVGSANCNIIFMNDTTINCKVGSSSVSSNQAVTISVVGYEFPSSNPSVFSFVPDPIIELFVPTKSSSLDSNRVVSITGKNFLSDPTSLYITIANCTCSILTKSDTNIACQLEEDCKGTGPTIIYIADAIATSLSNFEYIPISNSTNGTDSPTQSPTSPSGNSENQISKLLGPILGAIFGLLFLILLILGFLYVRNKRKTMKVKHRKKVKDVGAIIFASYKDSGIEMSDKTMAALEADLDALLICDNFEIYKYINEGPEGETAMKAVGLYIFEKNYILPVFDFYCQKEVETAENEKRLFRGPDVCSRIFRSVLKPIAFNMYWDLIGPIIDLLMESTIVQTEKKMTKATSQIEMMNQKDVESFELSIYKLQLVAHQLVAAVMKSKDQMPMSMREILMAVGRNVNDKFGHEARDHALTTFLILRFLSAIFMNPKPYNILKEESKPIPETVANSLTNLSSIIVKIASGKEFIEQDGKLAELNPFIKSHVQKFEKFFEEIMDTSNVANESNACESLPKNVKQIVIAEIVNSLLKGKDHISSIEDVQTRKKLEEFVEAHPKAITYSNKNFTFGNL